MNKRKQGRGRLLFVVLAVALMAFIFVLSGQNGEQSRQLSDGTLAMLQETGADRLVAPGIWKSAAYANIRKWAHVYLYALLGILLAQGVAYWPLKTGAVAALSAATAFVYSCTDELHQLFVPGRAALVADLWVDAAGYLPGILLSCLALVLWRKRKQ